jgi:hypothetical protein
MSGIVENLRDPYRPQSELRPLCLQAANEIERLRAAIDHRHIEELKVIDEIERLRAARRRRICCAAIGIFWRQ